MPGPMKTLLLLAALLGGEGDGDVVRWETLAPLPG